MIYQLNIHGKDKVQVAIDRLKAFEPPEGYWLAFSGGKDSVVIKKLADMAEVKYDAHYCLTSVDPPELVQFIKSFDDVKISIPKDKDGNQITMWNLIPKKKYPPTRIGYALAGKHFTCRGQVIIEKAFTWAIVVLAVGSAAEIMYVIWKCL